MTAGTPPAYIHLSPPPTPDPYVRGNQFLGDRGSAPADLREPTPCPQTTLSPPPSCCRCARLCWPRMMWQCHLSSSECRCYRLKGFSLLKHFPLSAGAAGRLLDQPVGDWLEHVGLPQYESKLLLNGFDDLHYMVSSSLFLLICFCQVWACCVSMTLLNSLTVFLLVHLLQLNLSLCLYLSINQIEALISFLCSPVGRNPVMKCVPAAPSFSLDRFGLLHKHLCLVFMLKT